MPQDPRTVVRTTTKLWSDIVRAARGDDVDMRPYDRSYLFSNGREFFDTRPYQWTQNGTGT